MSFKDAFLKANIQAIIALIVVVGGFATIVLAQVTQTDKNQIYMLMVMVLSYYFGSSRSTARKDEIIANQLNNENNG